MLYSSVAVLALSASAVVSPLTNLLHLHPHAPAPDTRITLSLSNPQPTFRDVKIDGHIYTIRPHESLSIKAPAGTVIYADSFMTRHKRGDAVLTVTPQNKDAKVVLD